jgi:hypothetical protein
MRSRPTLYATAYEFYEGGFNGSNRDLWRSLCEDVTRLFPEKYSATTKRPFTLRVDTEVAMSPDKRLRRYRLLQANVIRRPIAILELSGANLFTDTQGKVLDSEAMEANMPNAAWVRKAGCISLSEHLRLINDFLIAADEADWYLPPVELRSVELPPVQLCQDDVIIDYQNGHRMKPLLRHPAHYPPPWTLGLAADTLPAQTTLARLQRAFVDLFPDQRARPRATVAMQPSSSLESDADVMLILVPAHEDLTTTRWTTLLRRLEAAGRRFKIAKPETLRNCYACQNLLYDLFLLAGGVPWTVRTQRGRNDLMLALDAGHSSEREVSRWVKSLFRTADNSISLSIHESYGGTAEHLEESALDTLLKQGADGVSTVHRDGRFLREKAAFLKRIPPGVNHVLEVTKHPHALLYRGSVDSPQPTSFGDTVTYPDHSVLVQTIEQKPSDYRRPLRIRSVSGRTVSEEALLDLLSLCKAPTLGLYNHSRLPADIYWADLVSKLTRTGWIKGVGRGFNLECIIP